MEIAKTGNYYGMKAVAAIPIKLKNERFPGKNIKQFFDGTPLMHLLQKSLLEISELDGIYVYCSDGAVCEYILPGVIFLPRPEELDLPTATPQNIITEFIKQVNADLYMFSHVTSPFVTAGHLRKCLEAVAFEGYDSAFTGERMQRFLWSGQCQPLNFNPRSIPRTQDLPVIYAENGAAYAFKKETFEKYGRRVGLNPMIVEISGIECIDIDYPEDFELAETIYRGLVCRRENGR